LERLGQGAHQRAVELSWRQHAQDMVDIYEKVLKRS
jgi:hypothetical protein